VKKSDRDESMWIAIHKGIEAMLGISLYSYLYLKPPKTPCLSYYLLCFLFKKLGKREEQDLPGSGGGGRGWEERAGGQTMHTHVSKCKIDKIKERKKGKIICFK
jgi:hypothetical protein